VCGTVSDGGTKKTSEAPPHRPDADVPASWGERLKELVVGPRELRDAPVTRAIVILNVLVFVACIVYSRDPRAALRMPEETMLVFGANLASLTVGDGRVESLVASCFLHFDLLHVGFNLMSLRSVGPFVERSVGPSRYFPLFLISGIVGSAASALVGWTATERLSAGASGAICGIIAAAAVLGYRTQGLKGPLTTSMGRWLGIIVVLGFVAHFDNAAHIGGAVAGGLIAASWRRGYQYSKTAEKVVVGACVAVLLATVVGVPARNLTDKYLFLGVDERLRLAEDAMALGHCTEAREAATRALRLGRRSQVTVEVAGRVIEGCRGR
jgi:rhomboid protease GluP